MVELRCILLGLSLAALSNALAFPAPIETARLVANPPLGQPCDAVRGAAPTAEPDVLYHELARRELTVTVGSALIAPDGVLGYYTRSSGSGYYSFGCFHAPYTTAAMVLPQSGAAGGGYVGCCSVGHCDFITTCIDSKAYYSSSACDSSCYSNTKIGLCTSAGLGYCNLFTFTGLGITAWGCISSTSANVIVYTSVSGIGKATLVNTNLLVASDGPTISSSSVKSSSTSKASSTTPTSITPSSTTISLRSSIASTGSSTGASTAGAIASPSPTVAVAAADSGGLSTGAKIGIGVGAGVGGLLAIAVIITCLVKAGVFSSSGAGVAGAGVAAGAAGAGASAMHGTSGNMTQADGKPPYNEYYGNASGPQGAGNFTGPQGAGNFSGPQGAGNFSGPQAAGNFSGPPAYGWPTGAEAGNFTAPGGYGAGYGPTAAGYGAGNFGAAGGTAGAGAGPGASGMNPAYFAPIAAVPLAAGAAVAGRRTDFDSGSPPQHYSSSGGPPMAPGYSPLNNQREPEGGNFYHASELSTPQHSYVSPQVSSGPPSETGTPQGGYPAPAGQPPGRQEYQEMPNSSGNLPAGYHDSYSQRRY